MTNIITDAYLNLYIFTFQREDILQFRESPLTLSISRQTICISLCESPSQGETLEERTVKHFHFTAWPDHGVPENTEVLIQFRSLLRHHIQTERVRAPTVVHCRYRTVENPTALFTQEIITVATHQISVCLPQRRSWEDGHHHRPGCPASTAGA